jgi:hypothetical protein
MKRLAIPAQPKLEKMVSALRPYVYETYRPRLRAWDDARPYEGHRVIRVDRLGNREGAKTSVRHQDETGSLIIIPAVTEGYHRRARHHYEPAVRAARTVWDTQRACRRRLYAFGLRPEQYQPTMQS